MKSQTAYCSACDKDVHILITDEPSQDGHANLHDSEIVCLEVGNACTGHLCPVGAVSPTAMAARLVRSGLQTIVQPMFTAGCPDCGRATSHVIIEPTRATCLECGGIANRSELTIISGL